MHRFARLAAAAVLMLAPAASLTAQGLPDAKDVLARYRQAVGMDRFASVHSMHATGEFSVPAAGMGGQIEIWSARPNRSAMRVNIAGLGEIRTGYTGNVGWSMNPMEGARLLDGAEAKQAADDAAFESFLRPESRIASMSTVEKTTMNGEECVKVKIVWKSGREVQDCFSTATGLLIASVGTTESSMGAVPSTTLLGDYREVDGVRIPTRLTSQLMGAEQVVVLKDIRFNTVADSAFEPPAEIKALIRN